MPFLTLLLCGSIVIFYACSPAYVRTQPTYEEGFRPPRPGNNHVWVDGNWIYNRPSRAYNHSNGFWAVPNRGRKYQSGQWRNNSRGFYWTPGRWR
jgi:hypothetical protein